MLYLVSGLDGFLYRYKIKKEIMFCVELIMNVGIVFICIGL